ADRRPGRVDLERSGFVGEGVADVVGDGVLVPVAVVARDGVREGRGRAGRDRAEGAEGTAGVGRRRVGAFGAAEDRPCGVYARAGVDAGAEGDGDGGFF